MEFKSKIIDSARRTCQQKRIFLLTGAPMDIAHLPPAALNALRTEPVMVVNTAAIQRNFKRLQSMTPGRCAAVVKGDGYGHGMVASGHALLAAGAGLFFTARFEDAMTLRIELGGQPVIAVLDGIPAQLLPEAFRNGIVPVVNSIEQLADAAAHARTTGKRPRVFVHIDTAMHRLGLAAQDMARAAELLRDLDVLAYMTHFAAADDIDLDLCRRQSALLRDLSAGLPPAPLSIANSCGLFLGEEFHGHIVRPGKSTFGINPLPGDDNPMEEPASILAGVVQVRDVEKGDPVGYSATWRAPAARRIALLAIGYSNGYLRGNSSRGMVAFDGRLAPVVGRVSMDLTAVDVTDIPGAPVETGSIAEILGPHVSYRDLAQRAGTNEHEALIALGRGCRRFHVARG